MIKYRCRDCGREFSFEEYKSIKYCPDCRRALQEIRFYNPDPTVGDKGQKKLTPEQAQINKLWPVYMNSPIDVTTKYTFTNVNEWVRRRNLVYSEYRKKFLPDNLNNFDVLKRNFHSWLMFRNNLSWTTLQRTGASALEHPQKLSNLLLNLQNENVDIAYRIRSALQGPNKIDGLAEGIVTALLHTFNNEKYGVWNSRTVDTLQKLHCPTFPSDDLGETYKRVNNTLNGLAKDLNTNLTTLDGFMWFVSKKYEFL